jgi:hypothetical protein
MEMFKKTIERLATNRQFTEEGQRTPRAQGV